MFKKIPHTYVIVFSIIVIAALLTWLIPGGEYDKTIVEKQSGDEIKKIETIVPGSYHTVKGNPQTWQIFSAFFDGFVKQSNIIVFILMIGGAFWILNATKSIDVGILSFLQFTKKIEHLKLLKFLGVNNVVIVLIMLLFSVFGAVFGMSEETIAFIIIIVPLSISMGYDSIVGVNMCFVAAGLGFAGAVLNPFTIGIAQGLADLPLFSGIEYRLFCWVVINFVGIAYILRYAQKIHKNPKLSPVYDNDQYWRDRDKHENIENIEKSTPISAWITFAILTIVLLAYSLQFEDNSVKLAITKLSIGESFVEWPIILILTILFSITSIPALRKSAHFFILNLLMFTIVFLIVGVMGYEWYVMEIAVLFLVLGISSGMAKGYNADKIVKLFLEGAKDIMSAALVVGLAGGIIIILQNGKVIDTILNSIADSMVGTGKTASIGMMYFIQTVINIIIPSGSAKAALTMPIMSQLSDLIHIPRQATVMAFQFGDGFTNMITPTSPVLLGVLGVAKIPYEKWAKWILPFMIILIIIGFILLLPTVHMKLNGFEF